MTAEACVTCEETVRHAPVFFDGRPYCCVGCVAGGPCLCTYGDGPAQPSEDVSQPSTRPATSAGGAPPALQPAPPPVPRSAGSPLAGRTPLPESSDPRAPIPLRRGGLLTVVVHARGFADQRSLLTFAALMEQDEAFAEVSLTRVADREAWFAVRAPSSALVADAIDRFEGFVVRASVDQNLVEAEVSVAAAQAPPPGAAIGGQAVSANEGETLLPPRPRFRVFRPTPEPPARPSEGAPVPAAAPLPRPPAPAADMDAGAMTATPSPPAEPAARSVPPPPALAPAPVTPPPAAPAPAAPRVTAEPASGGDPEIVNPDARPGGAVATMEHLTLVVYPFHSFAALNDFQAAVRALHGVNNTRVRRFYRGTLHLAVDYEDIIPLNERIRDLEGFTFEVASESRNEIELVLEESGSLVASGDN